MMDELFGYEELPNLSIYRTAQKVVRDYMQKVSKKIEWVAEKLGTTKGYLYAQLEPARTDKPLSVDRVMEITRLTGDMRIIEEMAKEFGYVLCKPGDLEKENADPMIVVIKTLDLENANGDLAKVVKEAVKDGVLDEEEKKRIKERAYQLRKLAASLEESLR